MKTNEIVTLRPLAEDDAANIVQWRNSPSVRKNLYSQANITISQHLQYFREVVKSGKCVQYIISVSIDGQSKDIGTVFIKNIDHINHKGEFGMFIGEPDFRGKGFALSAVKQILRIAFAELDLNRVYLSAMADNIAAITVYEKAGFIHEGRLAEDFLRYDGFVDIILMGITKRHWNSQL